MDDLEFSNGVIGGPTSYTCRICNQPIWDGQDFHLDNSGAAHQWCEWHMVTDADGNPVQNADGTYQVQPKYAASSMPAEVDHADETEMRDIYAMVAEILGDDVPVPEVDGLA